MKFTFVNDNAAAEAMAKLALQHADPPGNDVWKTATVAEAYLYLGQVEKALGEYRRLLTLEPEAWRHQSVSLQAARIAAKLGDRALAEELEVIFTRAAKRVNYVFLSYSHRDRGWVDRLNLIAAPYLRAAEIELDLWEDTRLKAGQPWDLEIRRALDRAGVAVVLVSADFLASTHVMDNELPAMIKAADEGGLRLLWVYVSAASWEQTPLVRFHATHDTRKPLDALPRMEQDEVLKSVAEQAKQAAIAATGRFVSQPGDTLLHRAAL